MSFTLNLQRTTYTDNDTINAAAFNAQSCLSASLSDGQSYLFGLGAVGAPSVGFLGDPDTGLYSPGANQLALVTGGVARLSIDAAGLLTVPGALAVTAGLTGDVRGGLTAPLGTAAMPSVGFLGDPATGLYSPGANQLGFSTAGVARLTISATGAVTVPGAFTASGGLTVTGPLTTTLGAATAPSIAFSGDTNTGLYSPGADQLGFVTGGVARLTVSAGAITFNPGTGSLTIDASSNLKYNNATIESYFGGDGTEALIGTTTNHGLSLYTINVARLRISPTGAIRFTAYTAGVLVTDASGNVTASSALAASLTAPLGAVGTPSITFSGDTNTGLFSPGADQMALVTAGSSRLILGATGLLRLSAYGTGLLSSDASGNVSAAASPAVTNLTATGTITVNSGGSPAGTVRNITISTAAPSGGADGDVWLQYTA